MKSFLLTFCLTLFFIGSDSFSMRVGHRMASSTILNAISDAEEQPVVSVAVVGKESVIESDEYDSIVDLDSLAEEAAAEAFSTPVKEPEPEIVRLAPRQAGWFPMLLSPETLDGTFAGDVGFDPLGFASDREKLLYMREAEIKHARLAMLAVVGWPMSELWHKGIADFLGLESILANGDKAPSVLNGGLTNEFIYAAFGMVIAIGTGLEFIGTKNPKKPGDFGFDPLRLHTFRSSFGLDNIMEKLSAEEKIARAKYDMEYCEIRHGRLAMLGITGMCLQEFISGMPVVQQTPFFFGDPIF